MKKPSTTVYVLQLFIAVLIGFPLVAVGCLLVASIIFAPVGFAVIGGSAATLFWVQKNRIKKMTAWEFRDKPLYDREDRFRPWEE